MGEVLLAEHLALKKEVVVKLVHAELVGPELVERMRVEAQILASLRHPGIVDVTDLGETRHGRPYLVMERLHGRTLGEEVEARGGLPLPEAVDIVCQVLDALEAAHAAGVVHRDVKADNVFLHRARKDDKTVVKLLDFGVAKILAGGKGPLPSRFPTEEGVVMGTPRFCSPEQALGRRDIDHRADIYAAGALLYYLVTGYRLFAEKASLVDLLTAHARETPRLPSTIAGVSAAVDEVILKALAKRPSDRYQSAREMIEALRRLELRALPRTVRLTDGGPARSASSRRQSTDLIENPFLVAAAPPARIEEPPGVPDRPLAPAPRLAPPARPPEPLFDRFRFALIFCVTVLVAGAVLIALLRLRG